MSIKNEFFISNLRKLESWLDRNGNSGFDPYDIKSLPWVINLTRLGNKYLAFEVIREIVFEFFNTFPLSARRVFKVKPTPNAKGIALLSSAYLEWYILDNNPDYLKKSKVYLDWLENNLSPGFPGAGWGYPFDWQSAQFIPRNTPNGIVTTAVGEAFWKWYKFSGDVEYLAMCDKICVFLSALPRDTISSNQICFSYTPLFLNHVHNLNLFVAEFLIKIGNELQNQEWINLGEWAVNYTINNQMPDGSFDYNGPPEKPKNFSDNYHTGFVLRMLHSIWKLTGNNRVYQSLERCYNHYLSNFFENDEIPKLLPHRKYRIDIHSCAESILCLSELSSVFPQGLIIAEKVVKWTIENLQDESGYFYYGYLKSRLLGITFRSKIPYLRWGQAWMLRALVSLLAKRSD